MRCFWARVTIDRGSGLKFSVVSSHGAEKDGHDKWTQDFDYQFAKIKQSYRRIKLIEDSITDMSIGLLPTKE